MKTTTITIIAALAVSAAAHPSLMERQPEEQWTLLEDKLAFLNELVLALHKAGPGCRATLENAYRACQPNDPTCLCTETSRDELLPNDLPETCSSVVDITCDFIEEHKDDVQKAIANSNYAHRSVTRRQAKETKTKEGIEEEQKVLKEKLTGFVGSDCMSTLDQAKDTCLLESSKDECPCTSTAAKAKLNLEGNCKIIMDVGCEMFGDFETLPEPLRDVVEEDVIA